MPPPMVDLHQTTLLQLRCLVPIQPAELAAISGSPPNNLVGDTKNHKEAEPLEGLQTMHLPIQAADSQGVTNATSNSGSPPNNSAPATLVGDAAGSKMPAPHYDLKVPSILLLLFLLNHCYLTLCCGMFHIEISKLYIQNLIGDEQELDEKLLRYEFMSWK